MKTYEIMFIVKTQEESLVKKSIANMKSILENASAKIVEVKDMGQRKLAYPINNETNGYYYVLKVEAKAETIKEFDRRAAIDETIIRHLIIRLDEE